MPIILGRVAVIFLLCNVPSCLGQAITQPAQESHDMVVSKPLNVEELRQKVAKLRRSARLLRMQAEKRLGRARAFRTQASEIRTNAAQSSARVSAIAAGEMMEAEGVLERARERRYVATNFATYGGTKYGQNQGGGLGAVIGGIVAGAIANSAIGSGAEMDAQGLATQAIKRKADIEVITAEAEKEIKPLETRATVSEDEAEILVQRAQMLESLADANEILANAEQLRQGVQTIASRMKESLAGLSEARDAIKQ